MVESERQAGAEIEVTEAMVDPAKREQAVLRRMRDIIESEDASACDARQQAEMQVDIILEVFLGHPV